MELEEVVVEGVAKGEEPMEVAMEVMMVEERAEATVAAEEVGLADWGDAAGLVVDWEAEVKVVEAMVGAVVGGSATVVSWAAVTTEADCPVAGSEVASAPSQGDMVVDTTVVVA